MTARYDVIVYDAVGVPYTGSTPVHSGLGGSEFEIILLAEGLARRGRRVLVLNNTLLPATENGVEYRNHEAVAGAALECGALVVSRCSRVPPVRFRKLAVLVSDAGGREHDHFAPYFAGGTDATLVTVSAWQRSYFPAGWRSAVIPCMLPDFVYSHRSSPDARRLVYASAAVKGLRATIDAWQEAKQDAALAEAELLVCTPGYDKVDEAGLAQAGVRFLGSLPFARVVDEIAASAGLFYVNRLPETFGIVAALAEALGRRTHILCERGMGALKETVNSPLVTSDRAEFLASFRAAFGSPEDPRWTAAPNDFRESTLIAEWLRVLRLDGAAPSIARAAAPPTVARPAPPAGPTAPSVPRALPPSAGGATTVCLNMIVKNEAHVIERCLESVKPLVSSWVIVDTGSTDGTQEVIRRCMDGIPGELHERPWRDFATNRTEALELARGKADYVLVIDADDVLEFPPGLRLGALTRDAYDLRVLDQRGSYQRTHIFRADLDFRYAGVLHEVVTSPTPKTKGRLDEVVYRRIGGGARSKDPLLLKKEVSTLEAAVRDEPGNARYWYFLGRAHREAGDLDRAREAFEHRVTMGGWDEAVWDCLYAIAQICMVQEKGDDAVIAAFLRAHERRPQRAEPLCKLAGYCRLKGRHALAHVFASAAVTIARPDDILVIEEEVYAWRSLDEYAIASYYVGRHREAIEANEKLLANPELPESERERVRKNMAFSLAVLAKTGT